MTTATWAILAVTLAGAIGIVIGRLSAAGSTTPQPAAHALVMQNELREALDLDQLVLHYQPKVELGGPRSPTPAHRRCAGTTRPAPASPPTPPEPWIQPTTSYRISDAALQRRSPDHRAFRSPT